jgi:hypothetical protein
MHGTYGQIVFKDGYYFFSYYFGKLNNQIGYVKYINNIETDVDVGFIDYYPISNFLLEKLYHEKTRCVVEMEDGNLKKINDKLIIVI